MLLPRTRTRSLRTLAVSDLGWAKTTRRNWSSSSDSSSIFLMALAVSPARPRACGVSGAIVADGAVSVPILPVDVVPVGVEGLVEGLAGEGRSVLGNGFRQIAQGLVILLADPLHPDLVDLGDRWRELYPGVLADLGDVMNVTNAVFKRVDCLLRWQDG